MKKCLWDELREDELNSKYITWRFLFSNMEIVFIMQVKYWINSFKSKAFLLQQSLNN